MEEGLDVGLDVFRKMSGKAQNEIMFRNICHIRGKVKNDQIHRRLQYFWMIGLSAALGIKKLFGL